MTLRTGPLGLVLRLSLALPVMLVISPAVAQEKDPTRELMGPHFFVSASGVPYADTKDVPGELGSRSFNASLGVPLLSSQSTENGKSSRFQLVGDLRFRLASADADFLGGRRTLYAGGAGLSAHYAPGGKETFLLSAGIGAAEDADTVSHPHGRVTALFLGTHRSSETFSFSYGGGYSYVFGRGRALPALGLVWRPDEKWRVNVLLPFTAQARYRVSPGFSAGLRLGADGNLYQIANNGVFPGQPTELNLRMTGLKAGAEASVRVTNGAWLRLEGGILAFRKLAVWDGDREIQSTSVNPAPYGTLSLVWGFGRSAPDAWGWEGSRR